VISDVLTMSRSVKHPLPPSVAWLADLRLYFMKEATKIEITSHNGLLEVRMRLTDAGI